MRTTLHRAATARRRVARHRRHRVGPLGLVCHLRNGKRLHGVAVVDGVGSSHRSSKRERQVSDGGAVHLELHVVPRGPGSVARVDLHGLGITFVTFGVVATGQRSMPPTNVTSSSGRFGRRTTNSF